MAARRGIPFWRPGVLLEIECHAGRPRRAAPTVRSAGSESSLPAQARRVMLALLSLPWIGLKTASIQSSPKRTQSDSTRPEHYSGAHYEKVLRLRIASLITHDNRERQLWPGTPETSGYIN